MKFIEEGLKGDISFIYKRMKKISEGLRGVGKESFIQFHFWKGY